MIGGLRGVVEEVGPDWLMVNVGGVVFHVMSPSSTLSSLPQPEVPVRLHTHLLVREDGLTLFGFATRTELRTFQLLLTVNGVGPKSALALLSAIPIEQLMVAIGSEDTARLSSVPGIGKRTAARIALELKGKLGVVEAGTAATPGAASTADLLEALTSLGYSSAEASSALRAVPTATSMSLEEGLREVLRALSAS